jgi:hypothetical protein
VVFAGDNFEPEPEPEPRLTEDLELDEDGDLATESPSSSDLPIIKEDSLRWEGVDYVFDAEDGMMYHSETYDEVATFDGKKVTWNGKKFEMAHKKASLDAK